MVSINEYASIHDYKCNEGYINEDGVVCQYADEGHFDGSFYHRRYYYWM